MATLIVSPGPLAGEIALPPSKSHTMRAILFGAMGSGATRISAYLESPDTHAMVAAMRLFGAEIKVDPNSMEIVGVGGKLRPCEDIIQSGNSGQVLRFCGALAALSPAYTVITGDHSVRHNRPVVPLLSALQQLGAFATSSRLDGYAPIIIRGPIEPGFAELNGEDSQPVSALLIATSFLNGASRLSVKNPGERPWIDLTLSWLARLGGTVTHRNYEEYTIEGGLAYPGFEVAIPGDFSSAAFPLSAALITGSAITVRGVDMGDVQGDKKIIDHLIQMGAKIESNKAHRSLTVKAGPPLKGAKINVNEIIDALPILATLACFAQSETELTGASIARTKECDRIHAIAIELRKMGAQIEEREDGLLIAPSPLQGALLTSHADHRIAMALSVAALGAKGASRIDGIECIGKSYPTFIQDMRRLNAAFKVEG